MILVVVKIFSLYKMIESEYSPDNDKSLKIFYWINDKKSRNAKIPS